MVVIVMSKKINIEQELSQGGELPKALLSREEEVMDQARALGMAVFVADCSKARNLSALLRAFAKAVDYPVFFGKDMDALLDCLNETMEDQRVGYLVWIKELHSGDPSLTEDAYGVLEVLKEAQSHAADKKKILSYIVEHVGKHSAPDLGRPPSSYVDMGE